MKRTRLKRGSVVFNKRSQTWHHLVVDDGHRRSKLIGSRNDYRTKTAAWTQVERLNREKQVQKEIEKEQEQQKKEQEERNKLRVRSLIAEYKVEKMPQRASTQRAYESWFNNYILPKWGEVSLTTVQARPVELWLQSLKLSPKSKLHVRGLLRVLWDYAMWRGSVPTVRNPMELVCVKGATHRVRKPRSLSTEQFQSLLAQFSNDECFRMFVLLAVSFGLRISEVLGLKWNDIDWLSKTLTIERGVVKQIVDDVKTAESARTMVIADELLDGLNQWRQTTQFSESDDWIFASPAKLGRLPLSYMHMWKTLSDAATKAGIGHVSSHTFRHTHRTWLDSVGTPVGVQQKLMRHSDIRTTMNIYGDAVTADMREAHQKVVNLALGHVN